MRELVNFLTLIMLNGFFSPAICCCLSSLLLGKILRVFMLYSAKVVAFGDSVYERRHRNFELIARHDS